MGTDRHEYNILVVEDNSGDFALVEDFLFEQIESPRIRRALDFETAKKVLGTEDFDIVLLDLSLPDKVSEPLIREIIPLSNGAPVIVLTGYTDFGFGLKSLSLGVSDYILKDDLTSMSLYKSIIYSIERKKSVLEKEQSDQRYSELFNFSPQPMWVVDLTTLQFLDVNRAMIKHYGYSREELLQMTLRDIKPADDIPGMEKSIEVDRQSHSEHIQRVVIHKLKDGRLRSVDLQISPLWYKGRWANIVIATDITERLNYVQAIENQNMRLKEISWIQSHIVRAPISRIMGLVSLITNPKESESEKQLMLDYILESVYELDEVVRNITDKSRVEDFQALLENAG